MSSYTTVMRFVDTNVLVYAVSSWEADHAKRTIARRLLDDRHLAFSIQVLKEFYVQSTRVGGAAQLPHDTAVGLIAACMRFPVHATTAPLLVRGLAACARWDISLWDSAIIEAARSLGCGAVLTEDLNHGQDFDGVRIVNPFLEVA